MVTLLKSVLTAIKEFFTKAGNQMKELAAVKAVRHRIGVALVDVIDNGFKACISNILIVAMSYLIYIAIIASIAYAGVLMMSWIASTTPWLVIPLYLALLYLISAVIAPSICLGMINFVFE